MSLRYPSRQTDKSTILVLFYGPTGVFGLRNLLFSLRVQRYSKKVTINSPELTSTRMVSKAPFLITLPSPSNASKNSTQNAS